MEMLSPRSSDDRRRHRGRGDMDDSGILQRADPRGDASGCRHPRDRGQFGHGAVQLDPAYTPALPDGTGHILLQLKGPLTAAQEQRLRDIGVTLLEYIPTQAWKARVTSSALPALRSLDFVYALGDLYPVDKVPPAVLANDFNSRSLNSDGSLTLEIYF